MKRVFLGLAALSLIAAACGDDSDEAASTTPTTESAATPTTAEPAPDTTAAVPGDVPMRIVSLSPTATEVLFAIGAGDQVIAVDQFSDFPAEAQALPNDLSGYEPNVEAIAAYEPDLVIHEGTAGISELLQPLGIADWVGPAARTFDEMYSQIEQLGAVTGHIAEAAELVANMQADIEAAVAAAPELDGDPLTYFHELDNTLFSVGTNTFIGEVYSLFGLRNIVDLGEDSSDYPQLSPEFVISANPDLIFLADGSFGESLETVSARPGWQDIAAVQTGSIFVVDDSIASRWGPRIVEYIVAVSESLASLTISA